VAKPGGNRPLVHRALWLATGVASGVAIGIADSRRRERKAPALAAPARLSAPLAPRALAHAPPQAARSRVGALAFAGVLALGALGAAIAFGAPRDEPTARPTIASVAGTATVQRTAKHPRGTTLPRLHAPAPKSKAPATGFVPARVFAWPAVNGADGYQIRFYRVTRLIVSRHAQRPRFVLPSGLRLGPGRYRWIVLPHVRGSLGPAVVDSRFTVRRR
jgi:hypothetical protein